MRASSSRSKEAKGSSEVWQRFDQFRDALLGLLARIGQGDWTNRRGGVRLSKHGADSERVVVYWSGYAPCTGFTLQIPLQHPAFLKTQGYTRVHDK